MPRVPATSASDDSFYAVLANRPEILEAWSKLDAVLLRDGSSTLPTSLKEDVRNDLAQGVGCRYCATIGGPSSEEDADPRASLASAFAEQVVAGHGTVDDEVFDVLREEFSVAEIVELCAWICFKFGANVLGALMKLDPASEEQRSIYAELVSTPGTD